eukprot:COSAG02_NODE_22759_length_741_cov_0.922118_1_plen_218_part_01
MVLTTPGDVDISAGNSFAMRFGTYSYITTVTNVTSLLTDRDALILAGIAAEANVSAALIVNFTFSDAGDVSFDVANVSDSGALAASILSTLSTSVNYDNVTVVDASASVGVSAAVAEPTSVVLAAIEFIIGVENLTATEDAYIVEVSAINSSCTAPSGASNETLANVTAAQDNQTDCEAAGGSYDAGRPAMHEGYFNITGARTAGIQSALVADERFLD